MGERLLKLTEENPFVNLDLAVGGTGERGRREGDCIAKDLYTAPDSVG